MADAGRLMRDAANPRSIEQIDVDLLAANTRVAQLEAERAEVISARRREIIKAYDEGARRQQIVAAFGVTYAALSGILFQAGRTERLRLSRGLTPKQEAEYRRLTRAGVPSRTARNIALAVGRDGSQAASP